MPPPRNLRILLGLAPALALAAVALWSTCRVVSARAPDDDAWRRAADLVRKQYQPGDLIVFAPRWADPIGRLHLGDLIPIEAAARLDAGRYAVIHELAIRGASAPETRGLHPVWEQDVGGVVVRRFERAPATLVTDLVATAERGGVTTSGEAARSPAVVLAEVGFEPHRCVQIEPRPGPGVTLTFANVELGTALVGGVGLADVFKRRQVRAPIELIVSIDGAEAASARAGVDDGWVTFRAATTPHTATVTVLARGIGAGAVDRLVCLALEARR